MTNQGAKVLSVTTRTISRWVFALALVVTFNRCAPAGATEYHVTITADSTNKTSLRGTIIKANAAGGANAIVLTQPVYTLSVSGADEDACRSGDLDVTNGILTIIGTLSPNVVIMATNLGDRVFQVMPNAHLALQNVTIIGGVAPGDVYGTLSPGESGGAVYNSGTLDAENCVFFGNSSGMGNIPLGNGDGSGAGDGGAIYTTGTANLTSCTIYGNAAGNGWLSSGGNGGGIFNGGTCLLTNCTIINNRTGAGDVDFSGGAGGNGGGIFNQGDMVVGSCNISSNVCSRGADGGTFDGTIAFALAGGMGGSGGGLFNSGTLTMEDCTLSMNVTGNGGDGHLAYVPSPGAHGGNGGGLCNMGGIANLVQCTIGGNSCGNGGNGGDRVQGLMNDPAGVAGSGGGGGTGAGVYNRIGSTDLIACTIADNSAGTGGFGGDGVALGASAGFGGSGGTGGIYNVVTNTSIVTLHNVVVAQNIGMIAGVAGHSQGTNPIVNLFPPGTNGLPDLAGVFVSAGYNLVGIASAGNGLSNRLHDLTGSSSHPLDPKLAPLASNGTNTPTFDLRAGSPAIDAGDAALRSAPYNLTFDQRGVTRTFGASFDIGAVEYNGYNNGILQQPAIQPAVASGGGTFQMSFVAPMGKTYDVLVSTNLHDWSKLGSGSDSGHGSYVFQDHPSHSTSNRFYRVVLH